ncbi:hypothetical protein BBD31_01610 [Elizabethkingia anophelis]|uniref:hypothetical protein n=1 Tax=Elizabethkingia anophelis TaxID=1117645 RepID=UPI000994FC9F|nr:hypothetical protein [Elizabethkingia anophelis]AQW96671.1 hypothetical protein BBD31_01610 [Elizabethkingia anophelis]MDV3673666.1 hypothetical protein [Elizabethkingia anophelis]MDV3692390.1 hypothetical protein [Elizabethkingia anophelis]OPB50079.1 hypothetical protein BAY04_06890 [Elizabethkingia anophelis]SPW16795.1 Uncharacterised protein [Elizabethkingia anophelis]
MSNKTALQELIEKLESELYELDTKCDISEINDGVRFAYNHILTLINDGIIEKEKQKRHLKNGILIPNVKKNEKEVHHKDSFLDGYMMMDRV